MNKNEKLKVSVIDSLMGSGKTTAFINFFNEITDWSQRYIYITPYLKEVDRLKEACPNMEFRTPQANTYGKMQDLDRLIANGENIISTHELFKAINTERITANIKKHNYHIIIDEAIDIINVEPITKNDIKIMIEQKLIDVDKETNLVRFIDRQYEGKFESVRELADRKSVYLFDGSFIVWLLPEELLTAFRSVTVCTYLFKGSLLYYYLKLIGCQLEIKTIKDGVIVREEADYEKDKQFIRDHLEIYEGRRNNVGEKNGSLSYSWWSRNSSKADQKNVLKETYNWLYNSCRAKSKDALWTCFKDSNGKKPEIRDYDSSFVSCNLRGTNEYIETTCLAYLNNRYIHPAIKNWFETNNIKIDEEKIVLGEFLQWLFRSAIRKGDKVKLFLPSNRMRKMLKNWLN